MVFVRGNLLADIGIAAFALFATSLGFYEKRLNDWQSKFKMSFLDVYKTLMGYRQKVEEKNRVAVSKNPSDSEVQLFLKTYDEKVRYIDGLLGFYPESRNDLQSAFDELFSLLNNTKFLKKGLVKSIRDMVKEIFSREMEEIAPIKKKIRTLGYLITASIFSLLFGVIVQYIAVW